MQFYLIFCLWNFVIKFLGEPLLRKVLISKLKLPLKTSLSLNVSRYLSIKMISAVAGMCLLFYVKKLFRNLEYLRSSNKFTVPKECFKIKDTTIMTTFYFTDKKCIQPFTGTYISKSRNWPTKFRSKPTSLREQRIYLTQLSLPYIWQSWQNLYFQLMKPKSITTCDSQG